MENKKKLRHPFNSEIDLETFKHMFNINGSITDDEKQIVNVFELFNPFEPLLSTKQELLIHDYRNYSINYAFTLFDYNLILTQRNYKRTKKINPTELDNYINNELYNLRKLENYNSNDFYKYFINYYFVDPKETLEDKIKYINSMQELELPKKYIYDLINEKELYNGSLEPQDKFILNLGLNEKEYFNLFLKKYLNEYYTQEGFKYIKELYTKLTKTEAYNPYTYSEILKNNIHDEPINNDLALFLEIILNEDINKKLYVDPSINSYKDILNKNLESINDELQAKEILVELLKKELDIHKLTLNELKEYILKKYTSNDFEKLLKKHLYLIYKLENSFNINLLTMNLEKIIELSNDTNSSWYDLREELKLYQELTTAKEDSVENIYYIFLKIYDPKQNDYIELKKSINNKLNNINDESTSDYYIEEESKYLIKEHKKQLELLNEINDNKKGIIKEPSNNIFQAINKPFSFGTPLKSDELEYNNLCSMKEELKNKINALKQELNILENSTNYNATRETKLNNEIIKIENEIAKIDKSIKKTDIFKISKVEDNKTIELFTKFYINSKDTDGSISINYKIENNYLFLEKEDILISYPIFVYYTTRKNNQFITESFNLTEFSSKFSDSYFRLLKEIINTISKEKKSIISIEINDNFINLIGFTKTDKKRAILFIKQALAILKGMQINEAKLKTKTKNKQNTTESIIIKGIITDYSLLNNTINIIIDPTFFDFIFYKDEMINNYLLNGTYFKKYLYTGLKSDEILIYEYVLSILNQNPNKVEISLIKLLERVQKLYTKFINYSGSLKATTSTKSLIEMLKNISKCKYSNLKVDDKSLIGVDKINNVKKATTTKIIFYSKNLFIDS